VVAPSAYTVKGEKINRSHTHTHTHTPTENRTPDTDTHTYDKNNTSNFKRTPPMVKGEAERRWSEELVFTRYCHHRYCMVCGIKRGGRWWGV